MSSRPTSLDEEVSSHLVVCVNDEPRNSRPICWLPVPRPGEPAQAPAIPRLCQRRRGLQRGHRTGQERVVVLVHQDVYLPAGWPRRLVAQWRHRAKTEGGHRHQRGLRRARPPRPLRCDRTRRPSRSPADALGYLPADVDGLDEVLMVVPAPPRCASTLTSGGTCTAPICCSRPVATGYGSWCSTHRVTTTHSRAASRGSTATASGCWLASGTTSSPCTPISPRSTRGCSPRRPREAAMRRPRTQRARSGNGERLRHREHRRARPEREQVALGAPNFEQARACRWRRCGPARSGGRTCEMAVVRSSAT